MIECWNRRVRPCDEVVILGDLSWGDAARTTEILERLNGRFQHSIMCSFISPTDANPRQSI